MRIHGHLASTLSFGALTALALAIAPASGCSSNSGVPDGGTADGGDDGGSSSGTACVGFCGSSGGGTPSCIANGGACVPTSCGGGTGDTSISGTVYDPAGKNPLYGVYVYVPSEKPGAVTTGASCEVCKAGYSGKPISYAITDTSGKFTIKGVPAGSNIPIVAQIGKWRRQVAMSVTSCKDNAFPGKLTLPKNRGEGDIPNFAISTGGADSLECLLTRIGVDKAEYGPGSAGPGRVHIFQGYNGSDTSPSSPVASMAMWDTQAHLMQYDAVLLTCEGQETTGVNQQAMYDYANAGGRVFATHFHYNWFNFGPFANGHPIANWTPQTQEIGTINANILTTLPSGHAFPRGIAMKDWLGKLGALDMNGELQILQARHNADVLPQHFPPTIPWIAADTSSPAPNATQYLSFDTPIATNGQSTATEVSCGRVVYTDLHVGAGAGDYGQSAGSTMIPMSATVPGGCASNDLTAQEKALEYMLFDLSGCIAPPDQPAGLPPVAQ